MCDDFPRIVNITTLPVFLCIYKVNLRATKCLGVSNIADHRSKARLTVGSFIGIDPELSSLLTNTKTD